jgi:nitrate/nitrite transporter NarK
VGKERGGYPPASLAWGMWGVGAALYMVTFYQRVAPAVLTRELSQAFELSGAALGNLSAFYFYSYVAVQIPTGMLADRLGPRKLLATGAAVTALGILLFALAPSLAMANFGRLLIGGFSGVAFVCMLKLASHWMPPSRFAFATGAALFIGMMGATLAGAPLRALADAFGWRQVMTVSAGLTALVAIAAWFLVRDDPVERGYRSHTLHETAGAGHGSALAGLREVLGHRNTLLLFFIPGAMSSAILSFAGLWGVPFLVSQYAMTTTQAATLASVMLVAWSVSSLACGPLSERIGRRRPLYQGGLVVMLLLWSVLVYVPGLSTVLLTALLVAIGVSGGVFVLTFVFSKESVPPRLAGTVSGIANMGVMFGGLLTQPLMGWVLDRRWAGAMAEGVRVYDLAAWQAALSVVLVWGALSLVLLAFTRETFCRQSA